MDSITNGFGAQALDLETIFRALNNSYIATGCAPSEGPSALEVDVASGEVVVDGSEVTVGAQTVTLAAGDGDPRKDVLYVDASGTVQTAPGTPAPAEPSGEIRRQTYQPQPTDLSGMAGVPIAEVWVDAGASSVTSDDISDRRLLLGVGSTSVDPGGLSELSASRSLETVYTNTTGTALYLTVRVSPDSDTGRFSVFGRVDGTTYSSAGFWDSTSNNVIDSGNSFTVNMLVPPGIDYEISVFGGASASIDSWYEQEFALV